MRVVVTGSEGSVGSCLVRALLSRGDEPIEIDLRSSTPINILDADGLAAQVAGAEEIIHLAAISAWSGERDP